MANCKNCGAPLSLKTTKCRYCETVNDVDLKRAISVAPAETQEDRTCPRCKCKLLTIDLSGSNSFHVERCETCFGLFFDMGELESFINVANVKSSSPDYHRITALVNENFHKDYPVAYIKCPVCLQLMNRINYGRKSGVVINKCSAHGIWLDNGMLHHIMAWEQAGGQELERAHTAKQLAQDAEYQIWKMNQRNGTSSLDKYTEGYSLISIAKTFLKLFG